MAKKKTSTVIEKPVVVRVQRTVRTKASYEDANEKSGVDQVNSGNGDLSDDPGATETDLDTIEIRPFVTDPAQVSYNYGISRSVNFQTVSLGVTVTLPCYREEVEDAIEEAKQICVRRLKKENGTITVVLDKLVELRTKAEQGLARQGIA